SSHRPRRIWSRGSDKLRRHLESGEMQYAQVHRPRALLPKSARRRRECHRRGGQAVRPTATIFVVAERGPAPSASSLAPLDRKAPPNPRAFTTEATCALVPSNVNRNVMMNRDAAP